MATPKYATVSNDPDIDWERRDKLESLLNKYVFGVGPADTIDAKIVESKVNDRNLHFRLSGYAPLGPIVKKTRFEGYNGGSDGDVDFWTDTRYEVDDTAEFFRKLSSFLKERLVIKTISHTKLRLADAIQYRVDPDGTVIKYQFMRDGTVEKETLADNGSE